MFALPLIIDDLLILLIVSHVHFTINNNTMRKLMIFNMNPGRRAKLIHNMGGFSGAVLDQFFRAQLKRDQNKVCVMAIVQFAMARFSILQ